MPVANQWSAEEVEASVDAYHTLFERWIRGEIINKRAAYEDLANRYGRSVSAYDYRFRNIAYVLGAMGLPTLPVSSSASHVGSTAEATIRHVIETKGYFSEGLMQPASDTEVVDRRTQTLLRRGVLRIPSGRVRPERVLTTTERIVRDPVVKAWVLQEAAGHCENCGQPAPFLREDGTPFLEVHHVQWLVNDGSDTPDNAVALCPNCHRRFHYGADAQFLVTNIRQQIPRLRGTD